LHAQAPGGSPSDFPAWIAKESADESGLDFWLTAKVPVPTKSELPRRLDALAAVIAMELLDIALCPFGLAGPGVMMALRAGAAAVGAIGLRTQAMDAVIGADKSGGPDGSLAGDGDKKS
jgi:hypothetical protein